MQRVRYSCSCSRGSVCPGRNGKVLCPQYECTRQTGYEWVLEYDQRCRLMDLAGKSWGRVSHCRSFPGRQNTLHSLAFVWIGTHRGKPHWMFGCLGGRSLLVKTTTRTNCMACWRAVRPPSRRPPELCLRQLVIVVEWNLPGKLAQSASCVRASGEVVGKPYGVSSKSQSEFVEDRY